MIDLTYHQKLTSSWQSGLIADGETNHKTFVYGPSQTENLIPHKFQDLVSWQDLDN